MTSRSKHQQFVRSDGWNICNSWSPATKITFIKNSDSVYTHFIRLGIFVTDSLFTTRNSITARCLKRISPYHAVLTTSCTCAETPLFRSVAVATGTCKINLRKMCRYFLLILTEVKKLLQKFWANFSFSVSYFRRTYQKIRLQPCVYLYVTTVPKSHSSFQYQSEE